MMTELEQATWAFRGAFVALGIYPGADMAKELGELAGGLPKAWKAIRAMREAPEHQRVFAALDILRGGP